MEINREKERDRNKVNRIKLDLEELRRVKRKKLSRMKIFIHRSQKKQNKHTDEKMEGKGENAADLRTYSGFLLSSPPKISLKSSMFEVSAYVIVCQWEVELKAGRTDRKTDTESEEVR